ncbi:MAG: STAS domain-containing protein [Planctomycetota bacterium]
MPQITAKATDSPAGPACVVTFGNPKLVETATINAAGELLTGLLEKKMQRRIVLDFDGVTSVSSAMIGELIRLHTKLTNVPGGKLVICNFDTRMAQLLKMTKLDKVLAMADDVDGALAQFK